MNKISIFMNNNHVLIYHTCISPAINHGWYKKLSHKYVDDTFLTFCAGILSCSNDVRCETIDISAVLTSLHHFSCENGLRRGDFKVCGFAFAGDGGVVL